MKKYSIYRKISNLLTLEGAYQKKGRHPSEADLSIINNASLVIDDSGSILWVGPESQLNHFLKTFKKELPVKTKVTFEEINLKGKTVLPGFVDCHTHSIFAGNRFEEFEWRNQGVSYQEIAAKGGGILSTMKATRKASANELYDLALQRMKIFYQQGVTTVEVKSGYSLNLKDELKQLKVIQKLNDQIGKKSKIPNCVSTFLGAHALPPEFKNYPDYLNFLVNAVLPQVKKQKLSQRVDIFIEKGFFPLAESRAYLQQAQQMGFDLVIHADQLSLSGGSELAVQLNAKSADHVIQIQEPEIQKLAQSEVTSVLLPAADLYMKCAYPPARKLIDSGARVAIASDFNPGSSPTQDIMLVGLLSRLYMKMSLPEVITAYTINGAYALGLENKIGVLRAGHKANFIITSEDWRGLFYQAGHNPIEQVVS